MGNINTMDEHYHATSPNGYEPLTSDDENDVSIDCAEHELSDVDIDDKQFNALISGEFDERVAIKFIMNRLNAPTAHIGSSIDNELFTSQLLKIIKTSSIISSLKKKTIVDKSDLMDTFKLLNIHAADFYN